MGFIKKILTWFGFCSTDNNTETSDAGESDVDYDIEDEVGDADVPLTDVED